MSELSEEELHEYDVSRLEAQLQLLATPADIQLGFYPDGCAKADEMAEDFYEIYELRRDTGWADISAAQRKPLEQIAALLEDMSGPKPFWTEEALRTAGEWETIRGLAKQALEAFGWELRIPDKRFFG